jgi:glycosyltransferase involved in cell wall biosynthesis
MPKVSVIIPCYNHARYLPDAVGSVLAQTYGDFEIIIVNDGSTDDTKEVAMRLMAEHPERKIRLIEQKNSGLPTARNNGILAADGEYIIPLDADDMLKPGYMERTAAALESHPEAGLAYTWSETTGMQSGVMKHGEFTFTNLIVRDGPPCTALIRKSAWEKVGGYSPLMSKGGEDWEFGCSLFEAGYTGVVVPEVLFDYRKHGRSMIDEMVSMHALPMSRNLKLLHPRMFEPLFARMCPGLARAVIWIKYFTRDRVARFVYLRMPGLHAKLRRAKYGPSVK